MRLIDADALIQKLYEMKAKEEQYIGLENDVSVMIGSIGFEVMNMPTAYDIDNVVEELEERKVFHKKLANYESVNGTRTEMTQHLKAIEVLDKSIEIVKGELNENRIYSQ